MSRPCSPRRCWKEYCQRNVRIAVQAAVGDGSEPRRLVVGTLAMLPPNEEAIFPQALIYSGHAKGPSACRRNRRDVPARPVPVRHAVLRMVDFHEPLRGRHVCGRARAGSFSFPSPLKTRIVDIVRPRSSVERQARALCVELARATGAKPMHWRTVEPPARLA